jgi:hypothetical protein
MLVLIFIDQLILSIPLEWEIVLYSLLSIVGIVWNSQIGATWTNFVSEVHHTSPPSLFFDR